MRPRCSSVPSWAILIITLCLGCTNEKHLGSNTPPEETSQSVNTIEPNGGNLDSPGTDSAKSLLRSQSPKTFDSKADLPRSVEKRPFFACWRSGVGTDSILVRYAFYLDGTVYWQDNWSNWFDPPLQGKLTAERVNELQDRLDELDLLNVPRRQLLAIHLDAIKTFAVSNSIESMLFYDEVSQGKGDRIPLLEKWSELQLAAREFVPQEGVRVSVSIPSLIPIELQLLQHPDHLQGTRMQNR